MKPFPFICPEQNLSLFAHAGTRLQLIKWPKFLFSLLDMRRVKSNIAVGYIRVSLKKMAENGESLATQKDKIRSYCGLRDLYLEHIIEDAGISGKLIDNRKGFRRV